MLQALEAVNWGSVSIRRTCFLSDQFGGDQAGATFFRTEENLFSHLGGIPVRKRPQWAEEWL